MNLPNYLVERCSASDISDVATFLAERMEPSVMEEYFPFGADMLNEWVAGERTIAFKAKHIDDDRICGFALTSTPMAGRDQTHVIVLIDPLDRRKGLGSRMDAACVEAVDAPDVKAQAVVSENNLVAEAFVRARGFQMIDKSYKMSREPEAFEPVAVDGFCFEAYRGGDPATNAAIADQNRRLYANERFAYFTTPEEVEKIFETPGRVIILARLEETQEIAGFVDLTKEAFVCNLGVARKFWGTGLAHELSRRTITMGVELGVDRVRSYVRAKNAASIRMQKRVGMVIDETVYQYERDHAAL
jgi:ribosomal protein S18 acetylase RimI-like enzyme